MFSALRRRLRAPVAGHGDRPEADLALDDAELLVGFDDGAAGLGKGHDGLAGPLEGVLADEGRCAGHLAKAGHRPGQLGGLRQGRIDRGFGFKQGAGDLLGRQAAWPKGMFSALAGFVEPGESLEEACARELAEEAALRTLSVRYHSTQPWPYPSSLMIGLIAEVENEDASPDQTELEEVRWFTREDARKLLAGEIQGAWAPPPLAIAHHLIKAWAFEA